MKFIKGILYLLLFLYTILCIGLYFNQEKILFQPEHLSPDYTFSSGQELNIQVAPGIDIHCLKLPSKQSIGAILYLHGTKGSNRRCRRQAGMFADLGYDVYMPDYRGYGKSDGIISSENQMYQDVQAVYDYILKHYDEDKTTVVGYSLGTGMASYLAAHNDPQRLIMVSAFKSIVSIKNEKFPVVPNFLIKYRFDNIAHLKKVSCPVFLFHGDKDQLIPYESMEALREVRPQNTAIYTLHDASHRHSIFHSILRREVAQIMSASR